MVSQGPRVVGYYCLAAGTVAHTDAIRDVRTNVPDPAPVTLLGRLAVDQAYARQGIGSGLLKDAILRTLQAAETVGSLALLVHALDDEAATFYAKHGFRPSPVTCLTLMLPLRLAARIYAETAAANSK